MRTKERKLAQLSTMYQKQKELHVMSKNLAKIYLVESTIVSKFSLAWLKKEKGE